MKFFCINISKATGRRAYCEREFARAGIDVQFARGLDARANGITNTQGYIAHGRTGCYLSHLRLIDEVSRYDQGVSVIFEDDIRLVDGFKERLQQAMQSLPDTWDVAYIGWWPHFWNYAALQVHHVSDDWQKITKGGAWGAYGYMINGRKGAEQLLSILLPIRTTIDDQMFAAVIAGRADAYFIKEPLVHFTEHFVSQTQLK